MTFWTLYVSKIGVRVLKECLFKRKSIILTLLNTHGTNEMFQYNKGYQNDLSLLKKQEILLLCIIFREIFYSSNCYFILSLGNAILVVRFDF